MAEFMLKLGGSSVILGHKYYKGYFNISTRHRSLIKITKVNKTHNEFVWLDKVREIPNYRKYYCIPEELCYLLNPSDDFYKHVKRITIHDHMTIFHGELECCFIDYAGDKDVQETLSDMIGGSNENIWQSYKDIYVFAKEIMRGLMYLHEHKICHLDIKPENIVMNTPTRTFKIIDFGFSSVYPFDDFVKSPKVTPGYFPKNFRYDKSTDWLPFTEANDMIKVNDEIPMVTDRNLVYKLDSYSFGRVLYFLRYIYEEYSIPTCMPWWTKKSREQVERIIDILLENDVHKRKTIKECYELVIGVEN